MSSSSKDDIDYLCRCAADLGSFLGRSLVRLVASKLPDDELLSARQAGKLVGVSATTICRWIEQRRLPATDQGGGKYRIRKSDIITLGEQVNGSELQTRA